MDKIIIIFLLSLLIGCKPSVNKSSISMTPCDDLTPVPEVEVLPPPQPEVVDVDKHVSDYFRLKERIQNSWKTYSQNGNLGSEPIELARSKILIDSIFPYWLGTEWDFNGHTEEPLNGEIACGYFVSTTIRDLGVKINRYRIAQKGATEIITSLCGKASSIKRFTSLEKLAEHMQTIPDYEVLIVGLDYHVGFLYNKNGKSYFAHSDYIANRGVVIEELEKSMTLRNTSGYVVGNFTRSECLEKV